MLTNGKNMKQSSLGEGVAAEMSQIVESEEHVNMFSKVAKKKEEKGADKKKDKKSDKSKKEKPGKFPFFKKKDKKDEETKDDKKKDKKKMTSESMAEYVNFLTLASNTLDEFGFTKSSALTLQALDVLIGEVALSTFAHDPKEGLDDFEKDEELKALLNLDKGEEITHAENPALELELAGVGSDIEPTKVFDDVDDLSVLTELGLAGHQKSEDEELNFAVAKLDAWLEKYAHEDDLPEDRDPGFSYGPDESYPGRFEHRYRPEDLIRMPGAKKHPYTSDWKPWEDLSHEERLEHEMGAGLHERLDIDPDSLTNEEVEPELFEDPDLREDDIDHARWAESHKYDDLDNHDKEFEDLIRGALHEEEEDDEEKEYEAFESLRKALEESGDVSYDKDGEDFEDEE